MAMRRFISTPTNFLNRNTGFLVLVAIIIFGTAILHQQRDNKQILLNGNTTINQLNLVLCKNIPAKQCNLSQAVNKIQTHIDCIITFFGLTPAQRQNESIADICQFVPNAASPSASSATASQQSFDISSSPPANTTPTTTPSQQNNSHPIKQTGNFVSNFIKGTLKKL